jgi:beta-lactamase regulating signal transducer with metallopeptidase domain
MGAEVGSWLAGAPWARILGLVLDISIKAAAVCTIAGLATLLLRRSSAYARSMVWVFSLAALLALPLAQLVPPIWNLPVLPEIGSWFAQGAEMRATTVPGEKVIDPLDGRGADALRGAATPAAGAARFGEGWHAWAFLAWMAGTVLSLGWLLVRAALGKRILRRCEAADEAWSGLLEKASAELHLHRQVRLFESCEIGAAVTVGAINPAIVVPAGSSEWPVERRRYILSHELAHIKRWDGLIEVLVLVVKSIYWFNPLVWLAVKSLRVERERDCDDAVLNAGAKPSDYALFLMDIASDLGTPRGPVWQLSTISQGSNLKERIMCILDPKIDRTRGRRRTGIVSCFVVASIILPLSISGIWQTQAQENYKSKKEMELKKKEMQLQKEMQLKKKMSMENLSDEEKAKLKEEMALKEKMASLREKMASLSPEERIKVQWEKISQSENSAAVLVHDAIVKKGPDAGLKMAQKLKESGDDTYYFKEGEFNTLGYLFLFEGDVDKALAVFKLNVKMNPEAWNVYDSLGEALLAAGKYDTARKNYEKSLALNPENENGIKMLAKIEKLESGEEHVSSEKHKSGEEHRSSEENQSETE